MRVWLRARGGGERVPTADGATGRRSGATPANGRLVVAMWLRARGGGERAAGGGCGGIPTADRATRGGMPTADGAMGRHEDRERGGASRDAAAASTADAQTTRRRRTGWRERAGTTVDASARRRRARGRGGRGDDAAAARTGQFVVAV